MESEEDNMGRTKQSASRSTGLAPSNNKRKQTYKGGKSPPWDPRERKKQAEAKKKRRAALIDELQPMPTTADTSTPPHSTMRTRAGVASSNNPVTSPTDANEDNPVVSLTSPEDDNPGVAALQRHPVAANDLFGDENEEPPASVANGEGVNLNDVPTPQKRKGWYKNFTGDRSFENYRNEFMNHLRHLQAFTAAQMPALELLSEAALSFISVIHGSEEQHVAKETNAVESLLVFEPLFSSLKLGVLARSTVEDGSSYRMKVRYFSGTGLASPIAALQDANNAHLLPRGDPNVKVSNFIHRYFAVKFSNPDEKAIDLCVRRARTLYITATSEAPLHRLGGATPEETIVSAINFASMGHHGMYVNWLATSNEKLTKEKYGCNLEMETCGGTWQRRHLAVFLLKLAYLSCVHHVAHNFRSKKKEDEETADFQVVLQARTTAKEKAHRFYRKIGFEELGGMDSDTELSNTVFKDFPFVLTMAAKSPYDFIHFIRDLEGTPDLAVFRNNTGIFSHSIAKPTCAEAFVDVTFNTEQDSFSFPFSSTREHLMLLASGLPLFFLPFRNDVEIADFIRPSAVHDWNTTVRIVMEDREQLAQKKLRDGKRSGAKSLNGYLTDSTIDFMRTW